MHPTARSAAVLTALVLGGGSFLGSAGSAAAAGAATTATAGTSAVRATVPATVADRTATATATATSLWVGPHAVDAQVAADPALAAIAGQPAFLWLTDDTGTQATVAGWEAAAAGRTVPLVLYDIPQRDLGSYSAGGAPSEAAYATFVGHVAAGIGRGRATVVLEPDALGQVGQMSPADQVTRYRELAHAVATLKTANPATTVLLDASAWIAPATLATSLQSAGVVRANGFVLDTSNFETTASMETVGEAVLAALGHGGIHGRTYAVDTSRNGAGPYTAGTDGLNWCNPPGRGLGHVPATAPDPTHRHLSADLWVKSPGESDGTCHGGPTAGQFWTSYADGLVLHAVPAG